MSMIKLENVTKKFGNHTAVDDISLDVKKGEVFGFLGPNGAGKTTTIKMITGFFKPTKGKINVNGFDVLDNPLPAKKTLGYVADEPLIMEKVTGAEYINFIADVFEVSPETRIKRAEKLVEHFKLKDFIENPISTYSHGMKQKVSLISALIHNPDLWILDEPIVGLDPESAFILKKMMRNHTNEGKTVFFSTHIMEIAEKICDRIAIIGKGKIVFTGTVDELREARGNDTLEQIFLEVTGSESEKIDFSYLD